MKEKLLSIGSIVLLKNGTKKLMIIGYMVRDKKHKNYIFDYSGCFYPEGVLDSNQLFLFNHDQIEKVLFHGYSDEEQEKFFRKFEKFHKIETLDV